MAIKKIIFTLLFISISIFIPQIAFAEPVGKISLLEGSVDILLKGKTTAETVKIDMDVNIGDIIRTKSNSKTEIKFTDGSIIRLAQKSRMEIKEYMFGKETGKRKGTIGLLRGKIRSIVSKVAEEKPDFNITTRTAVAGVRATDFFVISQPLSTQVIVKDGIVAVKNISPQIIGEVMVHMNQMTNVLQNNPPPPPTSVKVEDMKSLIEATEPAKEEKKKTEEKGKTPEKTESSKQSDKKGSDKKEPDKKEPEKKEPDKKEPEKAPEKEPSKQTSQKEPEAEADKGKSPAPPGATTAPPKAGEPPPTGATGLLGMPPPAGATGLLGISPPAGATGLLEMPPTIGAIGPAGMAGPPGTVGPGMPPTPGAIGPGMPPLPGTGLLVPGTTPGAIAGTVPLPIVPPITEVNPILLKPKVKIKVEF